MGARRIIFTALSGAGLTSIFLQAGILSGGNSFFDNFMGAIVVWASSHIIGRVFGGK